MYRTQGPGFAGVWRDFASLCVGVATARDAASAECERTLGRRAMLGIDLFVERLFEQRDAPCSMEQPEIFDDAQPHVVVEDARTRVEMLRPRDAVDLRDVDRAVHGNR